MIVRAACTVLIACGIGGAVAVVAARTSSPPTAEGTTTVAASGPAAGVQPLADARPPEDETDMHAAINQMFALAPYGAEGEPYRTMLMEYKKRACMAERGFEYDEYPFVPNPPLVDNALTLIPTLPSEDRIRAEGYPGFWYQSVYVPDEAAWKQVDAVNTERANDPTWANALLGEEDDPSTSCVAEATEFLVDEIGMEADNQYDALVPSFAPYANVRSLTDPNFLASLESWRDCMSTAGYDFEDPIDASQAFDRSEGDPPSPDEVNTALADLQCRDRSDYRLSALRAMSTTFSEWMDENAGAVAELRATTAAEITKMRALAEDLGIG